MRFTVPRIFFFFILLLSASCSSGRKNLVQVPLGENQPRPYFITTEEYRIHSGDLLEIKFFYNSELNEQVTVRPDGRISLQLVNEVQAAGLTPAELSRSLRENYSKDLAKPEITVIVRTFGAHRVFVDGEVARPGMFPIVGNVTVLQAISQAGGMKNTGKAEEVLIIRRDPESRPLVISVDIARAMDGTEPARDIVLEPFDIVYVPRTAIANANLWVQQYLTRMMPQIGVTLSYPLGAGAVGLDLTNPWISE